MDAKMKTTKSLSTRARAIARRLEADKALYKELDDITTALLEIKFRKGHGAVLRDNFKKKNIVFRATAIKRFELEFE